MSSKKNKFRIYAFAFILMVSVSALLFPAGMFGVEWLVWLTLSGAVLANLLVLIAG